MHGFSFARTAVTLRSQALISVALMLTAAAVVFLFWPNRLALRLAEDGGLHVHRENLLSSSASTLLTVHAGAVPNDKDLDIAIRLDPHGIDATSDLRVIGLSPEDTSASIVRASNHMLLKVHIRQPEERQIPVQITRRFSFYLRNTQTLVGSVQITLIFTAPKHFRQPDAGLGGRIGNGREEPAYADTGKAHRHFHGDLNEIVDYRIVWSAPHGA